MRIPVALRAAAHTMAEEAAAGRARAVAEAAELSRVTSLEAERARVADAERARVAAADLARRQLAERMQEQHSQAAARLHLANRRTQR